MRHAGHRFAVDRAVEATYCIDEALEARHFGQYCKVVADLPLLLYQHGLGQTLGYLKMRGGDRPDSPYELVYQQLAGRLGRVFPVNEADILSDLTKDDSWHYLRCAEEARMFALTLLREVDAVAYEDAGVDEY